MNIFTYLSLRPRHLREAEMWQQEAFEFYKTRKNLPQDISVQNLRKYNNIFADEFDSLRHTYIGTQSTQKYGVNKTKALQDLNEYRTSGLFENIKIGNWKFATSWNSPSDRNKDLWNNHISRQRGLKYNGLNNRSILNKLMQDIDNRHEIIVDPNSANNAKYVDTPNWQKIWNKADKLWEKTHNQNFSVQNTGLSNSTSVSSQLIQVPQNAPMLNADYLANLGQLGQTGSVGGAIMGMIGGLAGVALGAGISNYLGSLGTVNAQIYSGPAVTLDGVTFGGGFHTGGTVPGQGEVLALLKGGETVRTKAQEEELRKTLYEKYASDYAPMVCGEDQNQEDKTSRTKKDDTATKPIHQQVTKDDEAFFLNLVLDAIDRNRMGLRTKIKGLV